MHTKDILIFFQLSKYDPVCEAFKDLLVYPWSTNFCPVGKNTDLFSIQINEQTFKRNYKEIMADFEKREEIKKY